MTREFTHNQFVNAYDRSVLSLKFYETESYYRVYRSRYERTLRILAGLPLKVSPRIVEIGGGQIALLYKDLFNEDSVVWDLNQSFAAPLLEKGVNFAQFDLLHDAEPPEKNAFDVVVMCEVVEHLPVALWTILEKVALASRDGGFLVITTPNIFRIRNLVWLLTGRDIFCNWELPERGRGLGHVTEFSAQRLEWQATRAKLNVTSIEHVQLSFRGSSFFANLGKLAALPFTIRPLWRDGLVMVCQRYSI